MESETEHFKRCSRCGEDQPLTQFHKQKGKPRSMCKACVREYAQNRRRQHGPPECSQCGAIVKRAGLCMHCRDARKRAKRQDPAYRQHRRDMARKWRKENPERWKQIYTRSNARAVERRRSTLGAGKAPKGGGSLKGLE